jgi:hypothetical protein
MPSSRGERLDYAALLERLEPIEHEPDDEDESLHAFDQASLARVLLNLVGVNQETEYALCQRVARHLLGEVPEPDDVGL